EPPAAAVERLEIDEGLPAEGVGRDGEVVAVVGADQEQAGGLGRPEHEEDDEQRGADQQEEHGPEAELGPPRPALPGEWLGGLLLPGGLGGLLLVGLDIFSPGGGSRTGVAGHEGTPWVAWAVRRPQNTDGTCDSSRNPGAPPVHPFRGRKAKKFSCRGPRYVNRDLPGEPDSELSLLTAPVPITLQQATYFACALPDERVRAMSDPAFLRDLLAHAE